MYCSSILYSLALCGLFLCGQDGFTYLHGVAMNSLGDIYAAVRGDIAFSTRPLVVLSSGWLRCAQEVSFTEIGQHQKPFPREMMSLRKWKRVKN